MRGEPDMRSKVSLGFHALFCLLTLRTLDNACLLTHMTPQRVTFNTGSSFLHNYMYYSASTCDFAVLSVFFRPVLHVLTQVRTSAPAEQNNSLSTISP